MKQIQSLTNHLVKEVVKLHTAKHRKDLGKFIAEGVRCSSALAESGAKLLTLFATERMIETAQTIATADKIFAVSDAVMQKMSTSNSPSGLLGVFEIPMPPPLVDLSVGLVLARVADPGNMGTLIRSAVAMGKSTIVVIEGADPWGPKVVQASAGAIGNANIFELSWQELLAITSRPPLCALVIEGGQKPSDIELQKALLVVGSEAHGIPPEWIHSCDTHLTLPMKSGVSSLNAAVAGSIALYLAR